MLREAIDTHKETYGQTDGRLKLERWTLSQICLSKTYYIQLTWTLSASNDTFEYHKVVIIITHQYYHIDR